MKKTGRKSKNVIDMRPGKHSAAMLKKRIKHRADNMNSPNKPARPMPRPKTKQQKKLDAARKRAERDIGWQRPGKPVRRKTSKKTRARRK